MIQLRSRTFCRSGPIKESWFMREGWRLLLGVGAWKITSYYSKNLKTTWSPFRFLDATMIDLDVLSRSFCPPTHRSTLSFFRAVSAKRNLGRSLRYSRWIKMSLNERRSTSLCSIAEKCCAQKPTVSPRAQSSEPIRGLQKVVRWNLLMYQMIMKNLLTSHQAITKRYLNLKTRKERKSFRKVASRLTWHFLTNAAYWSQWRNTSSTLTSQTSWTSLRMLLIKHKC